MAKLNEVTLAPGKSINLYELILTIRPESDKDKERPAWTLFGTGKFQLRYEKAGVGGSIGRGFNVDLTLSKLATGQLDLEIKAAPLPAATEKATPHKTS